eukprot:403356631
MDAQTQQELEYFEGLCHQLYSHQTDAKAKQQADQQLKQYTSSIERVPMLQKFLTFSSIDYVQYLSASSLKNLLTENWDKISFDSKFNIKFYILNYLCGKALQQDRQVLNMMMALLAKILRLSWFDLPDMQISIVELNKLFEISEEHVLVALLTQDQIITEMTYSYKGKQLSVHRRISMSFREHSLIFMFEKCLSLIQQIINQFQKDQINGVRNREILEQTLMMCLEICQKSLNFDCTSIMLNDTIEENSSTNLPLTWAKFVKDKSTTANMFNLLFLQFQSNQFKEKIKLLALQCAADFANVRHNVFDSFEDRAQYQQDIATLIINTLSVESIEQQILSQPKLHREFVRLLKNLESNFSTKDFFTNRDVKLFEAYIEKLFSFTLKTLKSKKTSITNQLGTLFNIWLKTRNYSLQNSVSSLGIIENYVQILLQNYIEDNLEKLLHSSVISEESDDEEADDDEIEKYDKSEECNQSTMIEIISRLMRTKIELSMQLLLQHFFIIQTNYEMAIQQKEDKSRLIFEKQLAFLTTYASGMFMFGMHSVNNRHHWYQSPSVQAMTTENGIANYMDFSIVAKVIYCLNLSIRSVNLDNNSKTCNKLNLAFVKFMNVFRQHVLGDSRVLSIARQIDSLQNPKSLEDTTEESAEQESMRTHTALAIILGQNDMISIIDAFIEKLLQILIFTNTQQELGKLAVEETLTVFEIFLNSSITNKILGMCPIVQRFVSETVLQFNLFQHERDAKFLVRFFRIISSVWVNQQYISNFDTYLSQLGQIITQITQLNDPSLLKSPDVRQNIIKLYRILRGTASGLYLVYDYNLFMEWLNPNQFEITKQIMSLYINDDDVCLEILKFYKEITQNKSTRLKIGEWDINGMIVFKEASTMIINYCKAYDCMKNKVCKKDIYDEKLRLINIILKSFHNIITGNYLCFKYLEFYNDNTFIQLSLHVFESTLALSWDQVKPYEKFNKKALTVIELFVRNYTEILFLNFTSATIWKLLDMLYILDHFNEYIYSNLQKPSKRSPILYETIKNFHTTQQPTFCHLLRTLVYTLVFEDHKELHNYSKCFHSLYIMCEQDGTKVIYDALLQEEKNEKRQQRICEEMMKLLENVPNGLEQKLRNIFNGKYIVFKNFLLSDTL